MFMYVRFKAPILVRYGGYVDLPQSLNQYAYGLNNPIRYTDPSGRCFDLFRGWSAGPSSMR